MNKRILDSVHGYISIPKEYCDNIIDTPYFQRLRRIEQTSSRSLFPSARHDRFIHSLGVFHIGTKIVECLMEQSADFPPQYESVMESYKLACLLHDIGHSPFSHTFENYFNDKEERKLSTLLTDSIKNEDFSNDMSKQLKWTSHEMISAYISYFVYGNFIKQRNADAELVVRMIIGCQYSNKQRSFENAVIELIHGELIDADRLDYVCRDAWASGYSTSSVDVQRLINAIRIIKDAGDEYVVCFTDKALNEIESVLNVKDFQQRNVITHHTVVYEQALLVKAMESAALFHFGCKIIDDKSEREKALRKICEVNTFFQSLILPMLNLELWMPMDDDFVYLMKYVKDDKYVRQWLTRDYLLKPLWKSRAEFYDSFPILRDKSFEDNCWLFGNECKQFISENFNIPLIDVWILKASAKYKTDYRTKIRLYVNGKPIKYTQLMGDIQVANHHINPFFFIYVPFCDNWEKRKSDITNALSTEISKYLFNRL